MPAALRAVSKAKQPGPVAAAQPASKTGGRTAPGTDGGLPRFLQRKCAACEAGGAPCAHCEEEEAPTQMAAAGGAAARPSGARIHAAAQEGVRGAAAPLPHLERIQAAFGQHDVSQVRARVGGPAAAACARMGAEAYTVGNHVGFKGAPDAGLAAHEAAHVVQQRRGVQLKDGIGKPGDPYERQAEEAAAAVTQGRSAESILNHSPGGTGSSRGRGGGASSGAPVQHRLEVNASRQFEPPPAVSTGGGRAGGREKSGGGDGGAAAAEPGKAVSAEGGEGKAVDPAGAFGEAVATEPGDAGTGPDGGAGGTGGGSANGGETQNKQPCAGAGMLNARCYREPIEEPATEPDEKPQEPGATDSKESMKGDSPDAEEGDDCPVATAISQQAPAPGAGLESKRGPGPEAAAGAGAEGTKAGPARSGPAGGEGAAAGSAPGEGKAPAAAAETPSPIEAVIFGVESQRGDAIAEFERAAASLDAMQPGVAALGEGVHFAPRSGESQGDIARRTAAETRATALFTGAAGRMEEALGLAQGAVPDRLGGLAESLKTSIAISIEAQKQGMAARIGGARATAFASAETARGAVLSEHAATLALVEEQAAAATDQLTAAHEENLNAVDTQETATLDRINQAYAAARLQHEALGPEMGGKALARGEEYAAAYHQCRIDRKDSFWAGHLTDRRAEAQEKAARETAKGYDKSLREAANKQAREAMKGRKKDRCGVIAAGGSARATIEAQFGPLLAAIESGRQQAVAQADAARDQGLASIDAALDAALAQLTAQSHRQRQAANDTGYLQEVAIEQAAHAAAASILRTVGAAVGTVQQTLAQVQATFAAADAPDAATLDGVLGRATGAVEGGLDRLLDQTGSGLGTVEERLQGNGAQAMAALEGVAASNDEQAAALTESFAGQMGALTDGTTRALGQIGDGYAQQTQGMATAATTAMDHAAAGFKTTCGTALTAVETQLAKSVQLLGASLKDSVGELDCEKTGIPKQAFEAASHEAPAWKSVLKWVLIIAIIVVVALVVGPAVIGAVGAAAASLGASAGAAALIGTVVGGAIVGAATSATIQVLNNWESNQGLLTGVGKAAIMGAIGGAAGAFLGAGAGALAQRFAFGVVAKIALNVAADTVLEIGTEVVTGNFSWDSLGMAVLMSAATGGFGEIKGVQKIQGRNLARGAGAVPGAGARAYAEIHAPPVSGEHAPAPRAAEHAPEPTAHAAAAETPAPPAPAVPAETAAPHPATGETAAPAAPGLTDAAARPPDAPPRQAHPDHPEVEPGFVAKQNTPDGHEIKVLKDGRIVICSHCDEMRMQYADELAAKPELRRRLDEIEALADPAAKTARTDELRADLESARVGESAGETSAAAPATEPSTPKPTPETLPEAAAPPRTVDDVRGELQRLKQKQASKAGLTKAERSRLPQLEAELREHYQAVPGETPEARRDRLFAKDRRESLADFNERLKGMEEEVLGGSAKGNQEDLLDDYLALRERVQEQLALPEKLLTEAREQLKPKLEEQNNLRARKKSLQDRLSKADSDRTGATRKLGVAEARGDRAGMRTENENIRRANEKIGKLEEQGSEVDRQLRAVDKEVREMAAQAAARERTARGVTPEHYETLRGRTPSDQVRREFESRPQIDEVYGVGVVGKLSPDHIVSMKEITQMKGFGGLTTEQQVKILNLPENFMGLDLRVNESKGALTWSEWQGHPDFGPIPPAVRAKMITREASLRTLIQARIDALSVP